MLERRKTLRPRTLLAGTIAFNKRASTLSCVVRNLTDDGARLDFEQGAIIPDEVDVTIPHRSEQRRSRIVWRARNAAGVAFLETKKPENLIPLDIARRLNKLSEDNKALRAQVSRLRGSER